MQKHRGQMLSRSHGHPTTTTHRWNTSSVMSHFIPHSQARPEASGAWPRLSGLACSKGNAPKLHPVGPGCFVLESCTTRPPKRWLLLLSGLRAHEWAGRVSEVTMYSIPSRPRELLLPHRWLAVECLDMLTTPEISLPTPQQTWLRQPETHTHITHPWFPPSSMTISMCAGPGGQVGNL